MQNKFSFLILGAMLASFLVIAGTASNAHAVGYLFDTDRFGYEGTVTRYNNKNDAESDTSSIETVTIEDRDAAFYFADGMPGFSYDYNVLMGSWWYSTASSGSRGSGNTNGNTGIGFMQLYDSDGSTDTALDMGFQSYDGTHYTEYYLDISGTDATAAEDSARFSVYDNVHDAGTYINYDLNIVAEGLEGTKTGGVITANNHPTDVTGSFSALFTFGGDGDGYDIDGDGTDDAFADDYYTIDLNFNMDNWAYTNRKDLTYPDEGFYASKFVQTPEPTTWLLFGTGLLGLLGFSRKKFLKKA